MGKTNIRTTQTIILTLALAGFLFAQPGPRGPDGAPTGTLNGTVYDQDAGNAVEYANVVLHLKRDSSLVTGGVTDARGRFNLTGIRPGRYYLEVSFIGYRTRVLDDVQIAPGAVVDLGRVGLRQAVVAVEGAEVVGERPVMSFQIDKKVIEVGRMATAASGTAVDVLEDAPSVKVDIEGNVSLRGSENFTLLVDGMPSPLDPSEALQQLPAASIERIEIITNPSARYDPEGVSGIINVILKKQRQGGISGTVNLSGGWPGTYGGSALVSYRQGMFSLFGGGDFRRGTFPGSRVTRSWTADSTGDTTFANSQGDGARGHHSAELRAGGELRLGQFDRTSFNVRYGGRGFGSDQQAEYARGRTSQPDTVMQTSRDTSQRGGTHLSANLEHQHRFGAENHVLTGSASYMRRTGLDWSTNLLLEGDSVVRFQRSEETGTRQPANLKLDYTRPFRQEDKLEAGAQASLRRASSGQKLLSYQAGGDTFRNEYIVDYSDNVQAFYTQYAGKQGDFGFQPGLRLEYSDRLVDAADSGRFAFRRWDCFPTLHASLGLPAKQQLMASYTRRINRPRGWELWPFITWMDAYNARRGNPDLRPELVDALEAGWQMPLGESRASAEAFYRITHDKVERIRSVYAPGVILHSATNVGADYSLGLELLFDFRPVKWYTMNLSGDLYRYEVTGVLAGRDFAASSFNWRGRMANELRLPTGTRVQLNLSYRSPSASAQGTDAAHFITDAAVRQEFFNRQLALTLQVRDLLGTGGWESESQGDDFYNYFKFTRQAPSVSLNLLWNFNNYRPERRRADGDADDMDNGGEEF